MLMNATRIHIWVLFKLNVLTNIRAYLLLLQAFISWLNNCKFGFLSQALTHIRNLLVLMKLFKPNLSSLIDRCLRIYLAILQVSRNLSLVKLTQRIQIRYSWTIEHLKFVDWLFIRRNLLSPLHTISPYVSTSMLLMTKLEIAHAIVRRCRRRLGLQSEIMGW